jgi:hypothetical protein
MKVYDIEREETSSKLHIMGVSIDDLDSSRVRTQVGFLSKAAITYAGTVRENIDPTGSFSEEEIIRVLTYLKVYDILENKSGGTAIKRSSSGANSRSNNELNPDKGKRLISYRVSPQILNLFLTSFRTLQRIWTLQDHW